MNQQNNIIGILREHFDNVNQTTIMKDVSIKRIQAKKTIFRVGDSIKNIFLLLQGTLVIKKHQNCFKISQRVILGDYQPLTAFTGRVTQIRTLTAVRIIILPFDYFFNLKPYPYQQTISSLAIKSNFLKYILKKLFKQHRMSKNETLKIQRGLAVIVFGIYKISKDIQFGQVRKKISAGGGLYSLAKKCQLSELYSNQIVAEDVKCFSSNGIILSLTEKDSTNLHSQFPEFDAIMNRVKARFQSHLERKQSLRKLMQQNQELQKSFLAENNQFKLQQIQITDINISQAPDSAISKKRQSSFFQNKKSANLYQLSGRSQTKRNQSCNIQLPNDLKLIPFYWNQYHRRKLANLNKKFQKMPFLKRSNIVSKSSDLKQSPKLQIPEQFRQNKFKLRMFFKMKNRYQGGFHTKSLDQHKQWRKTLEVQS